MTETDFQIYTESTPNPASMKFVTGKLLVDQSMDFPDAGSAEHSPFAQELFRFSFVKAVFAAQNFITITRTEGVTWDDVSQILIEFIHSALDNGTQFSATSLPGQGDDTQPAAFTGSETEIKIQQILESYVRPAVEQDGGAIQFKSFDNGIVNVILKGSCSGCPSSEMTLKAGIENLLKRLVPEVHEVVSEAR